MLETSLLAVATPREKSFFKQFAQNFTRRQSPAVRAHYRLKQNATCHRSHFVETCNVLQKPIVEKRTLVSAR
jgi:hypothetical protein